MNPRSPSILACLALTHLACTAPEDAPADSRSETDTSTDADEDSDDDSETGEADLFACEDPEFTVLRPLVGPGYNPEQGFTGEALDGYVVHSTQILVPPDRLEAFGAVAASVTETLDGYDASSGLIAYAIATEPNCGFQRTLGIWASTESMYAFVMSEAHVAAMSMTKELSVTGKVTHWEASAEALSGAEPVSWAEAMAKLDAVDPSAYY
ncbi:hypothetical protein PPSIR1_13675 [Plesiocystis pacifica SIR-1]|uniref:ABM domain-containing protein n=1 Tax=Plesiocystis pacifica SIR-1 TaxID=391625 RepID=A6GJJ3_9BACT|nr:hypothetical protein [Plesiocystis pacifica]EDM73951.1 hypothetical protein PPSIR1_13675 [Plesiocystis pacifica SIR-1]